MMWKFWAKYILDMFCIRLDKQLLENDDEIASLRGELELLGQQYAALKVDRESVTGQMALCTGDFCCVLPVLA